MLTAPLLKALSLLMSVIVSLVPALAPLGPGVDGPAAATNDDAADEDDAFTKLDALLDDAAGDDANETATPDANATPPEDDEPAPPEENVTFVKPKPTPKPLVFSASWDTDDAVVQPGGAVPLRLVVKNHHTHTLQMDVGVGNVTPGWAVTTHSKYLEIEPGEDVEVPVTFEAPFEARPGDKARFALVLTSHYPFVTRDFALVARVPVPEIVRDVDAFVSEAARYASPGDVVNYTLTLQNTGNANDTFTLAHAGGAWGWTASFTDRRVTLGPRDAARVTMSVLVPQDARNEDASFMNVTVRSVSDSRVAADLVTFTTVNGDRSGSLIALEPVCVNRPADVPYEAEAYAPERMCLDLSRYVPEVPFSEDAHAAAEGAEDSASDASGA